MVEWSLIPLRYRINSTNYTLIESGTIADTNIDLFYPSIAANTNGTVVICCNGCSLNTYVSAYAFVGATVAGRTTFHNWMLLKSGLYSDQNAPSRDNRWGTTARPRRPRPTRLSFGRSRCILQVRLTGPRRSAKSGLFRRA